MLLLQWWLIFCRWIRLIAIEKQVLTTFLVYLHPPVGGVYLHMYITLHDLIRLKDDTELGLVVNRPGFLPYGYHPLEPLVPMHVGEEAVQYALWVEVPTNYGADSPLAIVEFLR
jgi:hypothetical protein